MNKDIVKIGTNSLLMLTRKTIDIGLGLLISILIARTLGKEGQGIYTLVVLLPTMIVTFLNFGVGPATIYYSSKKDADIKSIIMTNIITGLIFSFLGIIIGGVIIYFIGYKIFSGINSVFLWIALISLPAKMLVSFLLTIFLGLQDFKIYNAIGIFQKILFLVLLVVLLFIEKNVVQTIIAFIVSDYITFLSIIFILLRRRLLHLNRKNIKIILIKNIFNYGIKAHLSNILAFLNYRLDMFILGAYTNPAAVGIYSVSVSLAERLWIFSQAISTVMLPKISSLEDTKQRNELTALVSRNIFVISVLISFLIYIFSKGIIIILFGKEYVEATKSLRILLPGIAIGSMSRILSNHLSGIGKPQINMYYAFITVGLNIILNIILIPKYGVSGAALATTITYFVNGILKILYFSLVIKIPLNKFLLIKKADLDLYKLLFLKLSRKMMKNKK